MTESYTMGFWTAKAGQEDALIAAWTEFAEWFTEQPGVREARLVRDINEASKFVSFAEWEGMDAIQAWKSAPEFGERLGRVRQHVGEFGSVEAELAVRVSGAARVT